MKKKFFKFTRRRLPHLQLGGSWYFVTFNSKRGPLPEPALKIIMETIKYDQGKRYEIFMAVVMPDHVHMLIRPLEKEPGKYFDLSEILMLIKGVSSRKINRLLKASGQLWWDESYDTVVRGEEEFRIKLEYMLKNPVKAGLVNSPEQYEFFIRSAGKSPCAPERSIQ
jgi:putative transposase